MMTKTEALAIEPDEEPQAQADTPARIVVRAKNASAAFLCHPGERILYAALRNGVPLPYECATGTCGTCKGRCGEAPIASLWDQAPGQVHLKPERGEALLCQSIAEGDCEITIAGRLAEAPRPGFPPQYGRGRLSRLSRLTHDVMAFTLALDQPLRFHAGQFVVLQSPGLPGFRAYSMVNHAASTATLDFVVKRKPEGGISEWLFGEAREGATLELFGPLGAATFHPEESKNILAIAGGSGIAGMMAILTHALAAGHFERCEGDVFFGVRTFRDAFYLAELSRFVQQAKGRLRVTVALSDEAATTAEIAAHPHLRFASGFVHLVASQAMAGRYESLIAYVAGPPPMVDGALRSLIVEARLSPMAIRYDKFQ